MTCEGGIGEQADDIDFLFLPSLELFVLSSQLLQRSLYYHLRLNFFIAASQLLFSFHEAIQSGLSLWLSSWTSGKVAGRFFWFRNLLRGKLSTPVHWGSLGLANAGIRLFHAIYNE
jgi:hypothetical protein